MLFLIPRLAGGGSERVITTLLQHFDRSQFMLTLAVVDTRQAVFRPDVPPDVEFIDLKCTRVARALPNIIRLIRQRRPDVVFSTLSHLNIALALMRFVLPKGVRFIARESTIASRNIDCLRWPWLWRWAYRRFYPAFDMLICQSMYMLVDLVDQFGYPSGKAIVINNPVDITRIRRLANIEPANGNLQHAGGTNQDGLVRLLAAGRLSREKGFDLLIEALALCDDPRMHLTIIGEGALRQELEALAYARGVAGQVCFAGFQQNPYPFFAKADALVLSSRFEGFPNVVLEALACGTPVIATPAPGGVREILEGLPSCELAEEITVPALAEAIKRWINRCPQRVDEKAVDPYSVERIVKQYEEQILRFEPTAP